MCCPEPLESACGSLDGLKDNASGSPGTAPVGNLEGSRPSQVLAYHHGSAGHRPETIFGGICYEFSTGTVDLARGAD